MVVPALPLVSAMLLPSAPMISLLPSVTLVTVKVSAVMVWLGSMALMVMPLNRSDALPFSVKVGVPPVALSVGASLTPVTLTLTSALLLVPPSPSLTVMRTVRVEVLGSAPLLLL